MSKSFIETMSNYSVKIFSLLEKSFDKNLIYFYLNQDNWYFFYVLISFLDVDGHKIEYIISSRGKIQLLVDGHIFTRNKAEGHKQSFYCIQYKQLRFVFSLIKYKVYENFNDLLVSYIWFDRCQARIRTYKNDRTEIISLGKNIIDSVLYFD